jgi:23S rRNA pseudouridine2457 synthase
MASILLFNKSYGVICQSSRDGWHPMLADYIALSGLLTRQATGHRQRRLLVLTDYGQLLQSHHRPGTHVAQNLPGAGGRLTGPSRAGTITPGVKMSDFTTQPAEVRPLDEPAGLWPRIQPMLMFFPASWPEY